MKISRRSFLVDALASTAALTVFAGCKTGFEDESSSGTPPTAHDSADDPLPSWNDGAARQAIIRFVQATTTPASVHFVVPEERIATFDQDGTLWVEQPMYTQVCLLSRPCQRAG